MGISTESFVLITLNVLVLSVCTLCKALLCRVDKNTSRLPKRWLSCKLYLSTNLEVAELYTHRFPSAD